MCSSLDSKRNTGSALVSFIVESLRATLPIPMMAQTAQAQTPEANVHSPMGPMAQTSVTTVHQSDAQAPSSTPTALTRAEKARLYLLYAISPAFLVTATAALGICLSIRGIAFSLIAVFLWDLAVGTFPSLSATVDALLRGNTESIGCAGMGGALIGAVVGLGLSVYYIWNRSLPAMFARFMPRAMQDRASVVTGGQKVSGYKYQGDHPAVVCAGLVVGSVAVPLGYVLQQSSEAMIDMTKSSLVRVATIGVLGAVIGTTCEASRERGCRAKVAAKQAEEEAKKEASGDDNEKKDAELLIEV
ncbi:hypothetical protein BDW22DRAFT_384756 [Trametopsis cervina]|nr:hypothetical protein BDW22DRAFT_384756 [Trametopsis cervina]